MRDKNVKSIFVYTYMAQSTIQIGVIYTFRVKVSIKQDTVFDTILPTR